MHKLLFFIQFQSGRIVNAEQSCSYMLPYLGSYIVMGFAVGNPGALRGYFITIQGVFGAALFAMGPACKVFSAAPVAQLQCGLDSKYCRVQASA